MRLPIKSGWVRCPILVTIFLVCLSFDNVVRSFEWPKPLMITNQTLMPSSLTSLKKPSLFGPLKSKSPPKRFLSKLKPFGRNNNNGPNIVSRVSKIRKSSRIVHKLMTALRLLNHDPEITLEKMFPLVIPLESLGNVTTIKQCYNDLVGKQRMNVFRTPIRKVVQTFFEQNPHHLKGLSRMIDLLKRVETFIKNLREFAELVSQCLKAPADQRTQYGLTPLSAMTKEEHKKLFNPSLNVEAKTRHQSGNNRTKRSDEPGTCTFDMDEPLERDRFDWRKYGVVTRVKNQGQCSSCFIFSTMAAFESAVLRRRRIQGRKLPPWKAAMSEQSVLNCFKCGDGFIHQSFEHLIKHGAPSKHEIPYRGRAMSHRCNRWFRPLFKLDNYCTFNRPLTDLEIQKMIQKYGPVSAGISGSSRQFLWLKGRYNGRGCTAELDHSVLIVGWDRDYWIIKNSWSRRWGVDGYLYLRRGQNLCGINQMITVPIYHGNN